MLPDTPLKPSTPIAYLVPATALKVTLLVLSEEETSSLEAIAVSPETAEPVKTPMIVSKLLPEVDMVTLPEAGAVQNHQTEAPPAFPAFGGSPDSLVAPTFEPVTVTDEPLSTVALANMSFTGEAPTGSALANAPVKASNKLAVRGQENLLILADIERPKNGRLG